MALLLNICKYNKCGLVFATLNELIQHIESVHINYQADFVAQLEAAKPAALPLSYVLPSKIKVLGSVVSEEAVEERDSSPILTDSEQQDATISSANNDDISNMETGDALLDEDFSADESSTFDFIMRLGSKRSHDEFDEKPYACPMPDCTKRYKNINGLRYHARNGHKRNVGPVKKYKCHCGRGYKTAQGLKAHTITTHNIAIELPTSSSQTTEETLNLLALANMPNQSFDQIHNLNAENVLLDVDTQLGLSLDLNADDFLNATANSLNSNQLTSVDGLNLTAENTDVVRPDFELRKIKIEPVDDYATPAFWQQSADDSVDEIINLNESKLKIVKKKSLDDDDIDVGDANDLY